MSDRRFLEFIQLFNAEAFFEAHEVLEDLWLECSGDQKKFYQGLIQCAVAFAHWQRSNPKGATQVAHRALTSLKQFNAEVENIQVRRFIGECEAFFAGAAGQFPRITLSANNQEP